MQHINMYTNPEKGKFLTAVNKLRDENKTLREALAQFNAESVVVMKAMEEADGAALEEVRHKRSLTRTLLKEGIEDSVDAYDAALKDLERHIADTEARQAVSSQPEKAGPAYREMGRHTDLPKLHECLVNNFPDGINFTSGETSLFIILDKFEKNYATIYSDPARYRQFLIPTLVATAGQKGGTRSTILDNLLSKPVEQRPDWSCLKEMLVRRWSHEIGHDAILADFNTLKWHPKEKAWGNFLNIWIQYFILLHTTQRLDKCTWAATHLLGCIPPTLKLEVENWLRITAMGKDMEKSLCRIDADDDQDDDSDIYSAANFSAAAYADHINREDYTPAEATFDMVAKAIKNLVAQSGDTIRKNHKWPVENGPKGRPNVKLQLGLGMITPDHRTSATTPDSGGRERLPRPPPVEDELPCNFHPNARESHTNRQCGEQQRLLGKITPRSEEQERRIRERSQSPRSAEAYSGQQARRPSFDASERTRTASPAPSATSTSAPSTTKTQTPKAGDVGTTRPVDNVSSFTRSATARAPNTGTGLKTSSTLVVRYEDEDEECNTGRTLLMTLDGSQCHDLWDTQSGDEEIRWISPISGNEVSISQEERIRYAEEVADTEAWNQARQEMIDRGIWSSTAHNLMMATTQEANSAVVREEGKGLGDLGTQAGIEEAISLLKLETDSAPRCSNRQALEPSPMEVEEQIEEMSGQVARIVGQRDVVLPWVQNQVRLEYTSEISYISSQTAEALALLYKEVVKEDGVKKKCEEEIALRWGHQIVVHRFHIAEDMNIYTGRSESEKLKTYSHEVILGRDAIKKFCLAQGLTPFVPSCEKRERPNAILMLRGEEEVIEDYGDYVDDSEEVATEAQILAVTHVEQHSPVVTMANVTSAHLYGTTTLQPDMFDAALDLQQREMDIEEDGERFVKHADGSLSMKITKVRASENTTRAPTYTPRRKAPMTCPRHKDQRTRRGPTVTDQRANWRTGQRCRPPVAKNTQGSKTQSGVSVEASVPEATWRITESRIPQIRSGVSVEASVPETTWRITESRIPQIQSGVSVEVSEMSEIRTLLRDSLAQQELLKAEVGAVQARVVMLTEERDAKRKRDHGVEDMSMETWHPTPKQSYHNILTIIRGLYTLSLWGGDVMLKTYKDELGTRADVWDVKEADNFFEWTMSSETVTAAKRCTVNTLKNVLCAQLYQPGVIDAETDPLIVKQYLEKLQLQHLAVIAVHYACDQITNTTDKDLLNINPAIWVHMRAQLDRVCASKDKGNFANSPGTRALMRFAAEALRRLVNESRGIILTMRTTRWQTCTQIVEFLMTDQLEEE